MCLLDQVDRWDEDAVVCTASSHHCRENPLRRNGQLSAVHAVEYAAQAIAAHCSLSAPASTPHGEVAYLASLHDVAFHVARLDDLSGDLSIQATRLIALARGAVYRFAVNAGGRGVCEGRANVIARGKRPSNGRC